jgi:hypothetical protein
VSKDDEYWHSVMVALSEEFRGVARAAVDPKVAGAWAAAAKEVRLTADQARKTAGTAERLVNSKPN